MNKLTQEEFIYRARNVHGNKYDYSKVVYVDLKHIIRLVCLIHGDFDKKPFRHLNGAGCPQCKAEPKIQIFLCNECNNTFLRKPQARDIRSNLHFCSKDCASKSMTNGALRQQCKQTCLEKYGNEIITSTKHFKDTTEKAFIDKYGVHSALLVPEVLNKIKITNIERYGRETYVGSEDHKSKMDFEANSEKAWKTKIKNGSCTTSKPEEKMYNLLVSAFGSSDIKRQAKVLKQRVDFYIASIDTYIQLDGVYWHGLNRYPSVIKMGNTGQDTRIHKQMIRDQILNQYMLYNNFRLLRITDVEFENISEDNFIKIIKEKL